MSVAIEKNHSFLAAFDRIEAARVGLNPPWLAPIRKAAIARFAELGIPALRHEDWRYTNVGPLAEQQFAALEDVPAEVTGTRLQPLFWGDNVPRIVFVNGQCMAGLSSVAGLPRDVLVSSLALAIRADELGVLESHLTRYADYQEDAFTALNTAFLRDGAFVHVPRGVIIERPLHLVFITLPRAEPTVSHPRNLIVAGDGSQLTIVETHVGLGETEYFTNAVTEIVAGENAIVDHYKVQRETELAWHIGKVHIHQQRSTNVRSHCISLGAHLARHNLHVVLDGEGGSCTLNGLYMVGGQQHVDNHLRVEHAAPHCDSRENFKGILDGRAHGVFTGRIVVHKEAQKTDGKQSNMNLLLSDGAQVDTKPQLEIFADDVKCTHGATIGQIDTEALFYLRSRGITEAAARSLLVYAFARESLEQIRVEPLRRHLHAVVVEKLPQGLLLKE